MRNQPDAEVLISGPAEEPITLDEAKVQVRQDLTDDDTYITGLIKAARQYCEIYTRRAFVNLTFDYFWHDFPTNQILYGIDQRDCSLDQALEIRRSPLVSVTYLKYIDTDGTPQTLTLDTDYSVDTKSEPGLILPAYGTSWPSPRNIRNAVQARVVCGYGADASTVPDTIKHAIKGLVAHWYLNRESVLPNPGLMRAPQFVDDLLRMNRVFSIR